MNNYFFKYIILFSLSLNLLSENIGQPGELFAIKVDINNFDEKQLTELDKFLSFDDETILNFYHHDIKKKEIDKNAISKIFKNFKL